MNEPVFFAQAKSLKKLYKKHSYVLTYQPPTKNWKWEVFYVHHTKFDGEAKSMNAAQKAAEKQIDSSLGIKERT